MSEFGRHLRRLPPLQKPSRLTIESLRASVDRLAQRVAEIERRLPCPTCNGDGVFHEERATSGGDIADVITGYCPDCIPPSDLTGPQRGDA